MYVVDEEVDRNDCHVRWAVCGVYVGVCVGGGWSICVKELINTCSTMLLLISIVKRGKFLIKYRYTTKRLLSGVYVCHKNEPEAIHKII